MREETESEGDREGGGAEREIETERVNVGSFSLRKASCGKVALTSFLTFLKLAEFLQTQHSAFVCFFLFSAAGLLLACACSLKWTLLKRSRKLDNTTHEHPPHTHTHTHIR